MSKHTIRDRLLAGMAATGQGDVAKRVPNGRYIRVPRMLVQTDGTVAPSKKFPYWFIGESGALRFGHNVSTSMSSTDSSVYLKLLAAGDAELARRDAKPSAHQGVITLDMLKFG